MQGGVYFHQGGGNIAQNNVIVDGHQYQARAACRNFLVAGRPVGYLPVHLPCDVLRL